jgi:hypothetical protein
VFGKGGEAAQIEQSWYREFALASDEEMRLLIVERTRRIAYAFTQPDEALPECSPDDRGATPPTQSTKCRDWCPARGHCAQMGRYYRAEAARSRANEQALASIVPEEGPSLNEREAKRRKEMIAKMMMAGNFFEEDFPRDHFRALLKAESEAERDDLENKMALAEMANDWTNDRFVRWRAWLDDQH